MFEKATFDTASEHLAALTGESYGDTGNALMKWVWNPHRAPLGLGNYDVNVLMYVLEQKGARILALLLCLTLRCIRTVKKSCMHGALTVSARIEGYKMQWIDKRRPVTKELLDFDAVEGVLCNVITSSSFLRRVWETRHWFAVKKVRICYQRWRCNACLADPLRLSIWQPQH